MLESGVRPRIVLVAMDLNPNMGTEGGSADKWLRALSERFSVEALVARRHEKDLRAPAYEDVRFDFVDLDGPVVTRLRAMGLYNLVGMVFAHRVMRILASRMETETYSLIHCLTPAGIYSYNHFYTLGLPVVVGPLGGALDDPVGFKSLFRSIGIRNRLRNLFYTLLPLNPAWRRYFAKASLILVGTELLLQKLPRGAAEKAVTVFDTTVDTELFRPLARASTGRLRIVYVGRLELVKGCMLLLEAFTNVAKSKRVGTTPELVLYGAGSQDAALRRAIASAGLEESVAIVGHVNHQSVPEVLNGADIFCLPTIREPGGGAILEAMACGLPVVTTDYGGPSYSVTADCGIKIEPSSPGQYVRDLEAALVTLLRDEGLRERMGKAGRQRAVDHFSEAALRERIAGIYETLIPSS